MHFYESMTVLTKDDIQIKTYANEHPGDFIIGVPKYIPTKFAKTDKLQIRTFDGKEYNRFNIRAIGKEDMADYVKKLRENYPDYFKEIPERDTWFMGVPKEKVVDVPDSKKGVDDLMAKDYSELDEYMTLTKKLIEFCVKESGVPSSAFGSTNSTLIGNYTYGRSDIDLLVFGKENYWKLLKMLENAKHELLRWRTTEEWKKHYVDYFPGMSISEEEYVKQMSRKKADGLWGETVFSFFCVSEEEDEKEKFGDIETKHLGLATIEATITEDYDSCVRPGMYDINEVKVVESELDGEVAPKRIFFYSRNLVDQARKGERVICTGMVENVKNKKTGEEFQQITLGLHEAYENWKGKEFLKVLW